MQGTQPTWTCIKCGAVGSVPVHRTDCQAHDCGGLAIATPVRDARRFLERMLRTYVAEAARLGGEIRLDLQDAIDHLGALIQIIDKAAVGRL